MADVVWPVARGREGWTVRSLLDRGREMAALEGVLAEVRDGLSGVLVLRGEAGIGKTMLLDWAARQADDMQLARMAGVQAETGMGFAGLHQLLVPFLGGLDGLPGPQRQALGSAFGLVAGPAPDRFLVGLAALTLLTDAAAEQPVLCLVDDAQWLDQVSVEVLGFIARRLYADRVGMLFTFREGERGAAALAGLPELIIGGLPPEAAGELLAASADAPVDGRVSAQVVAGVAGNPLALVELAGELTPEELSGTVPLAWPLRFGGHLEELYLARVRALPADTRSLLLVAAADPSGDPGLVYQAAARLGAGAEAGEAAGTDRLVSWQPSVRFRHPLIRSAAYYAAPAGARRRAHAALAQVTDPGADPDRRAWHRAEATAGPDEQVAAELERSAGRAQTRGGLAAAEANAHAGAFAKALELLATVEAGGSRPLDELQHARVSLLRGHIAHASGRGGDAPSLLLNSARRLEPFNLPLARRTYLSAWSAAAVAGHLARADVLLEVSRAARALPPPVEPPRPVDLVLDGLARLVTDGPAAAAPVFRQAVTVFASENFSRGEGLASGWMAAVFLWDDDAGQALMAREVRQARAVGALEYLPIFLVPLAISAGWRGDFPAAASLIAEADAIAAATGIPIAPYAATFTAALRGDQAELTRLIETTVAEAEARGHGAAATSAHWAVALLHNGLGRYADALAAAEQTTQDANLYVSMWALPELIEAAVRTANNHTAAEALERLAETTRAGGTDFGLGLEARCRALLSEGGAAEACYREAVERLGRTRLRTEAARAHLVYGEWLRRQRRRRDARDQLRTAFEMFDSIGMESFAARARAELRATGEQAPRRGLGVREVLTPQEEQIGRLLTEHLSNREIAARLFISASTVEYHLAKVFRKLGVSSRGEVARSFRAGKENSGQQG
jgi:DNA-binding CsgD family transcriptional regulator